MPAGVVLHQGEPMRIPADECGASWATLKLVAYADAHTGRVWPLADVRDGIAAGDLVPPFFDSRTWD